ncbi:MAG TPA: hotdog domain-containing protein, partial [Yinghuangia sp.]|nr:hotdog domain-containing protein [Yinghuangia sp.]
LWHGWMPSGPWLRGPDGAPHSAALAVLIDDTLGIAGARHQPDGRWSVTTELSVDYVAPPPCDGSLITSEGTIVASHARGALVTGSVQDTDAQTLAVMTLRSRYIPLLPELASEAAALQPTVGVVSDGPAAPDAACHDSLLAVLGASAVADGELVRLRVPGDIRLTNGSGALHGGVALAASQLAASCLLPAGGEMALSSTRITYLRQMDISGGIEFVARVVHGGRSFRVIEVVAYAPGGRTGTVATVAAYATNSH